MLLWTRTSLGLLGCRRMRSTLGLFRWTRSSLGMMWTGTSLGLLRLGRLAFLRSLALIAFTSFDRWCFASLRRKMDRTWDRHRTTPSKPQATTHRTRLGRYFNQQSQVAITSMILHLLTMSSLGSLRLSGTAWRLGFWLLLGNVMLFLIMTGQELTKSLMAKTTTLDMLRLVGWRHLWHLRGLARPSSKLTTIAMTPLTTTASLDGSGTIGRLLIFGNRLWFSWISLGLARRLGFHRLVFWWQVVVLGAGRLLGNDPLALQATKRNRTFTGFGALG